MLQAKKRKENEKQYQMAMANCEMELKKYEGPDLGTPILKSMKKFNEHSRPNEGVCSSPLDVGSGECESVEPPPGFEDLRTTTKQNSKR